MAAAADDDHVVFRLGVWAAPGLAPLLVVAGRVPREREDGIMLFHQDLPGRSWNRRGGWLVRPPPSFGRAPCIVVGTPQGQGLTGGESGRRIASHRRALGP